MTSPVFAQADSVAPPGLLPDTLPGDIELRVSTQPVPYREALEEMAARNAAIAAGEARELIWLLEHPPVYTAGTSAAADELLDPRFEVVEAGRGGRYTYHGPGQRIGYVLLDLKRRARDARGFVHALEGWVIDTLANFGVDTFRSEGRIGIWTNDIDGREAKIGAIGVRIRKWVTMHGFSVNIRPDLSHFTGIVPCGIEEFGVTSLEKLGKAVDMHTWDAALIAHAEAFLAKLESPCPPPAKSGETA
ncbi:lipoyl(octanoyl) transferase LipB [Novosphingobium sp. 9]|uniref:lipoyl(octanoyl) transferase LipB n=1 Tax=Novosphingobium sp. 9 TaxID=2025349 RepID=UPI0021B67E64|nr:lipoyl(octanoyl) transferase LipB [Novosphingobium sp. 9]